jgi:hypothetical protein
MLCNCGAPNVAKTTIFDITWHREAYGRQLVAELMLDNHNHLIERAVL